MNCTNQNTALIDNQNEISPLKARLNRMAIHVPGDNPTPAEVIPIIESRLAAHMKHISRTASSTSGDFIEWKNIHDAYTELLTDLRAQSQIPNPKSAIPDPQSPIPNPKSPIVQTHQNNFSLKKQPRSDSTVDNQQSTGESEVSFGESEVSSGESMVSSGEFKLTSSESNSPKTSPAPSCQSTPSAKKAPTPSVPKLSAEKPFDIRQHLDAASMRVCLDLQEYLSGRSPLDNLTPQQQQAILLLLEDHTAARVAEVLAQPEPYGFNLKTSESAIVRFKKRFDRVQKKYIADLDDAVLQQLLSNAHQSEETFQTAVQRLIRIRLLRAAHNPLASTETIDALVTSLTKLRKQDLAERKQLHAEKTK